MIALVTFFLFFGVWLLPYAWPEVQGADWYIPYRESSTLVAVSLAVVAAVSAVACLLAGYRRHWLLAPCRAVLRWAATGLAICVAIQVVVEYVPKPLPAGSEGLSFDSAAWKADGASERTQRDAAPRQRMLADLTGRVLPGKTRTEVEAELGLGEATEMDTVLSVVRFEGGELNYRVSYDERDLGNDEHWLLLWFDEAGLYRRHHVARMQAMPEAPSLRMSAPRLGLLALGLLAVLTPPGMAALRRAARRRREEQEEQGVFRSDQDRNTERARWIAALLSLWVYLIPLPMGHAFIVWGLSLAVAVFPVFSALWYSHGRGPAWIAADLAFAAAVQGAAGALLYRHFLHPRWASRLGLVAVVPLFGIAVNWVHLTAIPTFFLVDPERAVEVATWPTECTAADVSLAQVVKSPVSLVLEKAGEAWVVGPGARYGLLTMPGCLVREMDEALRGANFAGPDSTYLDFAIAGGGALFSRTERGTQQARRWFIAGVGQAPLPIEDPTGHSENDKRPILSNDGEWIAWGVRRQQPDGKVLFGILARRLRDGHEVYRPSSSIPGSGLSEILELTPGASELTVETYDDSYVAVDASGEVHWGPIRVPYASTQSFRRVGDGWVAWGNDYVGNTAATVGWSLPGGEGTHRVPKGRGIDSAAIDPSGRFIAVAVSRSVSLGDVKDSVYVLRTSDGSEVFRRFLPRYSRAQVAFLGVRHLAYSENGRTHVLRVPE